MCTVCGCNEVETRSKGQAPVYHHSHHHPHPHGHRPDPDHHHTPSEQTHDYGQGPAHAHAPGLSQSRMVKIEQDILGKNNQFANDNRTYFNDHGILALNLVSSPGSGKTSLLTRSIRELLGEFSVSVIEGDQQTSNDADRIRATGVKAIQINTGKGCHLDAHMVGHAVESLAPVFGSILFIENVGNLVCPAAFDLGEAHKVVILSVTEGEDKPIKYPDLFYAADIMLLNKIDLLPYLEFDIEKCVAYARQVNPRIEIVQVSAKSGEGMFAFYDWIRAARQVRFAGKPSITSSTKTAE